MTSFRFSEDEFERLESKLETLRSENQICKRKLDSKCQALLILSKELDQCRSERDQFKLMAEQLRERYQAFKKQLLGDGVMLQSSGNPNPVSGRNQDLGAILYETREQNKSLQFEVEDLKQKLHDAQGDIKLLREQIARHRVGTSDEGMNIRHFPAHEREDLVQQLESSRNQYCQLERDLQQVLDEKEELVTERDVYKTKYARLNQELNYILKGDEKRVVDIDALVMENKYLQERLKQMEEEKSMAMATVSKYKNLLERKKTKSSLKLGQSRSGSLVITQKQVLQVLEEKAGMTPPSTQAMADLQSLAGALLETVNDKNLALSHQRKTNKILGNRISELEKKIKTLEVSGLWNIPSNASNLQKLKEECEEVKTLIPQSSEEDPVLDIDKSDSYHDNLPHSGVYSSNSSSINSSPVHSSSVSSPVHSQNSPSHRSYNSGAHQQSEDDQETLLSPDYKTLVMDDLDLLPTKENIVKCVDNDDDGLALQNYKISTALGEAVLDPKFQQGLPYCMNEIESETEDTTNTEEHLKSLLEDMTAKMLNSQRSRSKKQYDLKSVNEDSQSESDIFIQSDHRDKDSRSSTPTCDKPLLSESAADKQGNLSEDTRNIEC